MRKVISVVTAILDIGLLLASAAILFTVVGLTVMVFDSGESAGAWAFFGTVASVCLALFLGGAHIAFTNFRKKRYLLSLLGSALPLLVFLGLQIVISLI